MLPSLPTSLLLLVQLLVHVTTASPPYVNSGSSLARARVSSIGKIQTTPTVVHKPRSLQFLQKTRLRSLFHEECEAQEGTNRLEWDAVELEGPNVEDRHTLAQLARMAGNAYALPGQRNWYDIDTAWSKSFPFGWEEGEGFRGHVFLSSDNNTVILSIKGTTLQGPTSKLDKYNDNLLFSCCCARHSWIMKTVCDCYGKGWQCDDKCLSEALIEDSLFYSVGTKLIDDLIYIYPYANIWLVGHSLGGALASLLGATYGLPAVAFESPGERMAAQRLHLPLPPPLNDSDTAPSTDNDKPSSFDTLLTTVFPFLFSNPHVPPTPHPPSPLSSSITHIYHTADPIPFGTCSGLYSACASAGFALETKCHLGKTIILDTVNKMKWLVDVRKHVIKEVVGLLDMPDEGETGVDWGEETEDGGDNDDDDDGDDDPRPCRDWDWCLHGKDEMGVISKLGHSFLRTWAWTQRPALRGWGPGRNKKGGEEKEKKKISSRVPSPIIETNCVDCSRWEFGSFKDEMIKKGENISFVELE